MKQIFLLSASLLIASAAFAQSDNVYQFNNDATPKTVRTLGSAPEFPFLQNKTSANQVYAAIKKHANDNTRAMNKLNDLLMQQGYANGAKDLQPGDITESHVKPGTEGNMGSRGYTYAYTRLEGNASEFKAWKIASKNGGGSDGSLYLFAKCGNAFYPKSAEKTACVIVPLNVTPDVKQVNLPTSGTTVTTNDKVYVYYASRRHKRHLTDKPVAQISERYHSAPIMVDAQKSTDVMPETYTVSLSMADDKITACAGSPLDVTTNVNVEKASSYTGNYPKDDHKMYKRVSKHHYKVIARKLRHSDRKAEKIARRTGVPVEKRLVKL